jgi:hypothetical protein
MFIARKKAPVGRNLVVHFGLQLGCKKTYGWLFSPHRMQTCLVCLSQGRGRSLIQWKQHTNFTLIMQKWLDSV